MNSPVNIFSLHPIISAYHQGGCEQCASGDPWKLRKEYHARKTLNSLTGIYIDQDEKIVFANRRLAEIYRYPYEALLGMENWRLVHPEDRELTAFDTNSFAMGQDRHRIRFCFRACMKKSSVILLARNQPEAV